MLNKARAKINVFNVLCLLMYICHVYSENLYEILETPRTATIREIRQAFKKKALKLHPDKAPDDPNAQANFLKLKKAYEVLKDEELRKKYDLYGEDGINDDSSRGQQYKSWNYYHDNFGIYDDDPEIITLSKADFEQSVLGSEDIWFVNFYHPMCSHCHTLAPTWRKLSLSLSHVVRIGAVNCDDDFMLCSSQGINSYPTLISYPQKQRFSGSSQYDDLLNYIVGKLKPNPFSILLSNNWNIVVNRCEYGPWIMLPTSYYEEVDDVDLWKIKLGALFETLLCLGEIDCSLEENLCKKFKIENHPKYFNSKFDLGVGDGYLLSGSVPQNLYKEVLELLPEVPILSVLEYERARKMLRNGDELSPPLLVIFSGENDDDQLEFRKLPSYLSSFELGRIKCEEAKEECDGLYISKTPTFALFKNGGGYELYQGRNLAKDVAVFARESSMASRFQVLTPEDFSFFILSENNNDAWFVDFYAPWCPPCRKLLPEFRKASRLIDVAVKFGSMDCTVHSGLCQQQGVRQYPTTVLYIKQEPHFYMGYHSASQLIDFIKDTIDPKVIELDKYSFEEQILRKPKEELWVVDFFANWCGPCREMTSEYKRFARLVSDIPSVYVSQIDCALHASLCRAEHITSYPTVRLFPFGSSGSSFWKDYRGWSRDADSFHVWLLEFLPSKVTSLDGEAFDKILRSTEPHLIYFFAPWCGPCQRFAPIFNEVAARIEAQIAVAKIDCQAFNWLCSKASIRAYPTVIFYPGRKLNERHQDAVGYVIPSLNQQDIVDEVLLLLKNVKHKLRVADEL